MFGPEYDRLTETQKEELKKLRKSGLRNGFYIALRFITTLFMSNILVNIINAFFVNSGVFLSIGLFVNMVFSYLYLFKMWAQESRRIESAVKKILKDKDE